MVVASITRVTRFPLKVTTVEKKNCQDGILLMLLLHSANRVATIYFLFKDLSILFCLRKFCRSRQTNIIIIMKIAYWKFMHNILVIRNRYESSGWSRVFWFVNGIWSEWEQSQLWHLFHLLSVVRNMIWVTLYHNYHVHNIEESSFLIMRLFPFPSSIIHTSTFCPVRVPKFASQHYEKGNL